MFSLLSFKVLCFAFQSLAHFELIFVCCESWGLRVFWLFWIWMSDFSAWFVEKISFPNELPLVPLSKINWPSWFISGLYSVLLISVYSYANAKLSCLFLDYIIILSRQIPLFYCPSPFFVHALTRFSQTAILSYEF